MLPFGRLLLTVVLMTLALPLQAADATLIVDRRAESISLFFKLPATDFEAVFGTGADALLTPDGVVDVPRLYDGTFPLADEIFAATTVRVSGEVVPFEAMSMMVHDPDVLPVFATPYDAEVSIAVCTSPETVANMSLATLEGYAGYFGWKVDGFAELEIDFPATGRGTLRLRVREYVNLDEVWDETVSLEDGASLSLSKQVPAREDRFGWLVVFALALAVFAAGMIWPRVPRRPRKTP